MDWTPATHPQLGNVEVGGFAPNARVNPPASALPEILDAHADFALWLAGQLPEVEVVETLPLTVTGKVQKGRLRGLERRRAMDLLE